MSVKFVSVVLLFLIVSCGLPIFDAQGPSVVYAQSQSRAGEKSVLQTGKVAKAVWLVPLHDFEEMFAGDAPRNEWDRVARHVNVVRFNAGYIKKLPEDVLVKIINDLKSRNIAVGMVVLALNWVGQEPCGKGVEGYGDPGMAKNVIAKIKAAGGTIDYIEMDEPLYFHRYWNGKDCCHGSIENTAQRTAQIIKIYKDAFPNAVIGDVEPFPAVSNQPHWKTDYAQWVKAFQRQSGTSLSFLHLDFAWGNSAISTGANHAPNRPAIQALALDVASVARANGLQVGMIYNGEATAKSDSEWVEMAKRHMNCIEDSGAAPEQAIIETWNKTGAGVFRPANLLPVSDSGSLGSLVQYYTTQFNKPSGR
ncbi:MAG: hypothetical protein P4L53_24565 [Candidatus Obscuribacterales bacterium]|nr:hypothetical protein [Candidatus Obscuribacterales bacterium]